MPQAQTKQISIVSSALPQAPLMIDNFNQGVQLENLLTGCLSQAIDLVEQEGQSLSIEKGHQQGITLVLKWPASESRAGQGLDQSDQNDLMALTDPIQSTEWLT